MTRGDHGLVFPEIRLDREEASIVLRESLYGECRNFARRADIARR